MDDKLEERLAEIEQRIKRLETKLDLVRPSSAAESSVHSAKTANLYQAVSEGVPVEETGARSARLHARPAEDAPHAEVEPAYLQLPGGFSETIRKTIAKSATDSEEQSEAEGEWSESAFSPRAPTPDALPLSLEQTIGLKWAGWAGAAVLVIGAGFAIRFAYDQGWLGHMPPIVRLLLLSLFGFALIGAGEWVYRKINVLSAIGLFGAGVAVLFLVSYAGHALWGIYAENIAFLLMGAATVVGSLVAMRGKFVSIAVLSLVGGNFGPILLGPGRAEAPFLAYLLMLQAVALILAWWGASERWWILRVLSLVITSLWTMTAINRSSDLPGAVLIFTIIYALLYQVELAASALRSGERREQESPAPVVFSFVVTALFVAALLYIFPEAAYESYSRAAVVVLCAGAAVAGSFLPELVGISRRNSSLYALTGGYLIQAFALLIVSVPVAFSRASLVLGWEALALAFAAAGYLLRHSKARRAAALTWFLDLLYLPIWLSINSSSSAIWFSISGYHFSAFVVLALLLALSGHVIAALSSLEDKEVSWVSAALRAFSFLLLLNAAANVFPPFGVTTFIVCIVWLLILVDAFVPVLRYSGEAALMLLFASGKWLIFDTLHEAFSRGAANKVLLFNPRLGVALLCCISVFGLFKLRGKTLREAAEQSSKGVASLLPLAITAAIIIVFAVGLSFEVQTYVDEAGRWGRLDWPRYQLKGLYLTLLWLASAWGFLFLHSYLDPENRRAGAVVFSSAIMALSALFLFALWAWAVDARPAAVVVIFNLQVLAALAVIGSLAGAIASTRRAEAGASLMFFNCALAVLVLFVAGYLEIDRAFLTVLARQGWISNVRFAQQVAHSIYCSCFAIGLVIGGFRYEQPAARYMGLALFALTLLKVVFVDLAQLGAGYRILSFFGLGMLLLVTSVLYGRGLPTILGGVGKAGSERDK